MNLLLALFVLLASGRPPLALAHDQNHLRRVLKQDPPAGYIPCETESPLTGKIAKNYVVTDSSLGVDCLVDSAAEITGNFWILASGRLHVTGGSKVIGYIILDGQGGEVTIDGSSTLEGGLRSATRTAVDRCVVNLLDSASVTESVALTSCTEISLNSVGATIGWNLIMENSHAAEIGNMESTTVMRNVEISNNLFTRSANFISNVVNGDWKFINNRWGDASTVSLESRIENNDVSNTGYFYASGNTGDITSCFGNNPVIQEVGLPQTGLNAPPGCFATAAYEICNNDPDTPLTGTIVGNYVVTDHRRTGDCYVDHGAKITGDWTIKETGDLVVRGGSELHGRVTFEGSGGSFILWEGSRFYGDVENVPSANDCDIDVEDYSQMHGNIHLACWHNSVDFERAYIGGDVILTSSGTPGRLIMHDTTVTGNIEVVGHDELYYGWFEGDTVLGSWMFKNNNWVCDGSDWCSLVNITLPAIKNSTTGGFTVEGDTGVINYCSGNNPKPFLISGTISAPPGCFA